VSIGALGSHVEPDANATQALLDQIDWVNAPCASCSDSLRCCCPDNYVADNIDGVHVCLVSLVASSDVPDTGTILPASEGVN
jgi:hypothetical protein